MRAGSLADELAVAHDDGRGLRARGAALRGEVGHAVGFDAGDQAVAHGPVHGGVGPVGDAAGVGELAQRRAAAGKRGRVLGGVAIEDDSHLLAGDVNVRGERAHAGADHEAAAHAVVNALVRPVGRAGHITEAVARAARAAGADGAAAGGRDDLFLRLAADGAGVGAHAGGGGGRRRGHFARVPLVRVCARGGDDLGLDLAADGAGIGAHAGGGLGRLGGHLAAVPLVAERGLAVALFGRAAAAAGIEVVAVRRAGGCHGLGELIVVRTRRGDGGRLGRAADGAGERAHARLIFGRLRGHGAVIPGVLAGGGDLLGRDDLTAVGADGVDAAGLAAGGGHGVFRRAVARVQTCTLAADGVALPLAVRIKRPAVDRVGVVVDGDDSGLEAVLGRAGGLDRRGCAVAAHVPQRGAAGERVVADARHGAGQLHVGQRGAALEAAVGDGGHAGGQRHIRQRDAAAEGGRAELRHRRGDGRSDE